MSLDLPESSAAAVAKQAQALVRTVAKTRDIFIDERLNLMVVRDTPEARMVNETVLRSQARGDMYVQVVVETPQNLSPKQRELLEAFEAEAVGKSSPESEGFFAKVKDFFDGLAGER